MAKMCTAGIGLRLACYKFVELEGFFVLLMNAIIQVCILEQILRLGELQRNAEAQLSFLVGSGTAVGKFLLS